MKSFAVALATLFASASALTEEAKNIRKHLGVDRVISIQHEHIDENIRSLLVEHDADHFGTHDTAAHLKLSPEAIAALEKKGIHFEDTTEKWINHFEENYNDKNFFCTEGTEACSRRDMQAFYSSYQTLEAIHQRITDVAAANPTKAAIGSMGTSFQGRDLKYIKIGDLSKPIVFYQCNIHAREWLPPMYCTYMAETLLANGGHVLLNTLSFIIIPSVNPDGYVYSYTTSSTWRKTRKPNSGSSCVGTDGNRNWADHHCGQGASTSPCSETYCGITPFDQPETKAVSDFATTLKGRLFSFADIHSYGGYWMSPYGWTYALPPASVYNKMRQCFEAAAVAVRATNGLSFITGSSANAIYIAAGGSDDWFNSALDVIYSFSVELRGSSFQPAATNIMPSNLEIFNGMVASLNCAINLELSSSAPTNFPTPAPVTAAPVPPVSTPTNFPTPAPVQTPVPTPFPTPAPTCVDLNPNGITYSNGAPAPCPELVSYCTVYTFVAQRCPKTCGTCSLAVSQKSVSPAVIGGGVAPGVVYALVPVAAALVAGLAAALVIIRRQKAQVLQNATAAVSAETKEVVVEDKKENVSPAVLASTPSGKNAPKDMFDV